MRLEWVMHTVSVPKAVLTHAGCEVVGFVRIYFEKCAQGYLLCILSELEDRRVRLGMVFPYGITVIQRRLTCVLL